MWCERIVTVIVVGRRHKRNQVTNEAAHAKHRTAGVWQEWTTTKIRALDQGRSPHDYANWVHISLVVNDALLEILDFWGLREVVGNPSQECLVICEATQDGSVHVAV